MTLTTTIHGVEPRIDFEAVVDWREVGDPADGIPGLTISFPIGLRDLTSRMETPFGVISRNLDYAEEQPSLRFASLSGIANTVDGGETPASFTLLQDCKYGHSIHGDELRLRILRSSYDPDKYPEFGATTVRYSIYLHDSKPTNAELVRLGASWNHPLIVQSAGIHAGPLGLSLSSIDVKSTGVVVTALKPSESGDGIILRVQECEGADTDVEIDLAPELTDGITTATLTDLLERPIAGHVTWQPRTLRFRAGAYSVMTVLLSASTKGK